MLSVNRLSIILFLIYFPIATSVIYRIQTYDKSVIINGGKYRESVGNDFSQLIFESNTDISKFQVNAHKITSYEDFQLLGNKQHGEWNIESDSTIVSLYKYHISISSNEKLEEIYYAHNINFKQNNNVNIIVLVNGNVLHSIKDFTDSVYLSVPIDNDVAYVSIEMFLYNPHNTKIELKSHTGSGYEHNANCWILYKKKRKNNISPQILQNNQNIFIQLQNKQQNHDDNHTNNVNIVKGITELQYTQQVQCTQESYLDGVPTELQYPYMPNHNYNYVRIRGIPIELQY